MTTVINGSSPSITFSDSTTQTTAFTGSASLLTSGTLPTARLPSGTVIQVVSAMLSTTFTTTSSSYVTANSVNITLSNVANKLISMAWFPITNNYGSFINDNLAILVNGSATNNQGNAAVQISSGSGGFMTSIVRYDTPGNLSNTITQSISMTSGNNIGLLAGAQLIVMEVVA